MVFCQFFIDPEVAFENRPSRRTWVSKYTMDGLMPHIENIANLVRNNMVEEGHTKAEAEAGIDVLLTIVDYFGGAKIELGGKDGRMRARVELAIDLGE